MARASVSKNKKSLLYKILDHSDKTEIIAKLAIDIPPEEIFTWLSEKYSAPEDHKFILTISQLQEFKDHYLDIYNNIQQDVLTLQKERMSLETIDSKVKDLVKENPTYQQKLAEYIDKDLDVKTMVKNLVLTIEYRAAQLFDQIQQDPRNIKMDRVLIEMMNTLLAFLTKYDDILNGNQNTINISNSNITIQMVDQQMSAFQNAIKNTLSKLDYETSLLFLDLYNQEIQKLNPELPQKPSETLETLDIKINELNEINSKF